MGRLTEADVKEQRAALAEACGLRLHRGPSGGGCYHDGDGEMVAEEMEWQPDWIIDHALLAVRALFVIGEISFQVDGEAAAYQLRGVARGPDNAYIRGKVCDSASEAAFDAALQALERGGS